MRCTRACSASRSTRGSVRDPDSPPRLACAQTDTTCSWLAKSLSGRPQRRAPTRYTHPRSLGLRCVSDSAVRRDVQALVALAGGSFLCLYGAHALFGRLWNCSAVVSGGRALTVVASPLCRRAAAAGGLRAHHRADNATVRPRVRGFVGCSGGPRSHVALLRNPEALHFRPAFMSLNHRGTRRAS